MFCQLVLGFRSSDTVVLPLGLTGRRLYVNDEPPLSTESEDDGRLCVELTCTSSVMDFRRRFEAASINVRTFSDSDFFTSSTSHKQRRIHALRLRLCGLRNYRTFEIRRHGQDRVGLTNTQSRHAPMSQQGQEDSREPTGSIINVNKVANC